jgi:hypothetical protein
VRRSTPELPKIADSEDAGHAFQYEAGHLSGRWGPVFPIPADLGAYVQDAQAVAAGMLDGITAGGKKIRELIPFFADCERARTLFIAIPTGHAIRRWIVSGGEHSMRRITSLAERR